MRGLSVPGCDIYTFPTSPLVRAFFIRRSGTCDSPPFFAGRTEQVWLAALLRVENEIQEVRVWDHGPKFAVAMGKRGYAITASIASPSPEVVPLNTGVLLFVIMDSRKERALPPRRTKKESECATALRPHSGKHREISNFVSVFLRRCPATNG